METRNIFDETTVKYEGTTPCDTEKSCVCKERTVIRKTTSKGQLVFGFWTVCQ